MFRLKLAFFEMRKDIMEDTIVILFFFSLYSLVEGPTENNGHHCAIDK